MQADVNIESLGKAYSGKIIYISPAMDAKTQTFTVRIIINNPDADIKAGMFARTNLGTVLRPQALFIPREAILSNNGKDRVFVLGENNQAVEREVKVGLHNDIEVEILSGINAGEQLITTNLSRLKNGMTVATGAEANSNTGSGQEPQPKKGKKGNTAAE